MTIDISKARIFICPCYIDLRKDVNGLSAMTEGQMSGEPLNGNVYLFCNRERRACYAASSFRCLKCMFRIIGRKNISGK
jgi:hypothetical protein